MNKKATKLLKMDNIINDINSVDFNELSSGEICSFHKMELNNILLTEEKILKLIETKYKIKFLDMEIVNIEREAALKISKEFALKNLVIPFKMDEDNIYVFMANPLNNRIIDELSFLLTKNIVIFGAISIQIKKYINKIYSKEIFEKAIKKLGEEVKLNHNLMFKDDDKIKNAPAVEIVDLVLKNAISQKASDIHFEPFEKYVKVRVRIDGVLYKISEFSREVYIEVAARIKVLSGMDISQKLNPQDGKLSFIIEDQKYNFRVSSIPTLYGEKIVIRILYNDLSVLNLESLGFDEKAKKEILKLVLKTKGVVLITGPTGSGKTTTLHAMLAELDKTRKNIITIEDPVEYRIDGINQINVNNKCGLTFANTLRSVLRQDPDILMVGEIRDEETAHIAVRAAVTGHLVLSTMHTYNSISSVLRLLDMNIPAYLIEDAVTAVMAQRLVRKICPYCKKEYNPKEREIQDLKLNNSDVLYKGNGCSRCNYTGYLGRTAVYEILEIEQDYRKISKSKFNMDILNDMCKSKGFISFEENCRSKVKSGITTYEEYLKIIL